MFVSYSIANPLTTIRIPRRLARSAEVLVRPGDAVEPTQIVARALAPADFCIVDVARDLDIPIKRVKSYLKVQRGDTVTEGTVIAARGGLGGRVCRAPIDGTIVGSGRGRLLLEAGPAPIQLSALIPGIVVEILASEGVVIETVGGFVHGAWGNGQEAYGVLRAANRDRNAPLQAKQLDPSLQGAIVLGGGSIDRETLERATEVRVRGIIVGSVAPDLIPQLNELDFPVITTEGIGKRPMSQALFDLLVSWNGREVAACGRMQVRWPAEKPYVVIPMPARAGDLIDPEAGVHLGTRVRALCGPHAGVSGTVVDVPSGLMQLETGARLAGVVVELSDNQRAWMPLINLERLL